MTVAPPIELQREWSRRLRASGFRDLEGATGAGLLATDVRSDTARAEDGAATAEYYRRALAFLHDRRRRWGRRERLIWREHAAGRSYTEIAQRLRRRGVYRKLVAHVVPKLRAEMLAPRPRRGRPLVPGGRSSRTAWKLQTWLTDAEADALHWVAREMRLTPIQAAREALRVLVSQKGGRVR